MSRSFVLYGARKSSATYRARIALRLKGLPFDERFLDLTGGDHQCETYRALNPQGLVPALVAPDGLTVTQSAAILEYLEDCAPSPPLLPADPAGRARVRSLALHICCDIHPLNNMRVRNHIAELTRGDRGAVQAWLDKWSRAGFSAIEAELARGPTDGPFCHGASPTLADACLVPQVYNASLLGIDLAPYPRIRSVCEACNRLEPFLAAHPDRL